MRVYRLGGYWESVPRMSTVVEAYTLSVYEVVPSEITAHFISMVSVWLLLPCAFAHAFGL